MPDQLTDRARKAAEEGVSYIAGLDKCEPIRAFNCVAYDECKARIPHIAAIFERHMREMTLVELGQLVQKREAWLQKKIEAGRWMDCQDELRSPDRLIELENELSEGCKLIETVMHQHDDG